jgi:hypothetical protein
VRGAEHRGVDVEPAEVVEGRPLEGALECVPLVLGLDRVEAAVHADADVVILALALAVNSEALQLRGKLFRIQCVSQRRHVVVETERSRLRRMAGVAQHTLIFDAVHNLALDPKRSVDFIESIAAEHDRRA